MFLLTDKSNTTFGGFSWDTGISHATDNPNFYFRLYDSLDVALYIAPFFGFYEFNVWEAEGSGEIIEESFCKKFSCAKTLSLKEFSKPSKEKRINAAALCCLNVVKDQEVLDWCLDFLKRSNSYKEKAFVLKSLIPEGESEEFSCSIPLFSCALDEEKVEDRSAGAIFRSILDSIDVKDPIDIKKILKIATNLSSDDIAAVF